MKIYSTRHGQTDYNKNDCILGITDIELNETGLMQAEQLANNIKNSNLEIDIIISSPMKRALKTAQIISAVNSIEIITDERIREWDYGNFEGKHRLTDGFSENKCEFAVKMGKTGESLLQLSHRIYSFLDDIIEKYDGKNILVVSHGGICRVIETYFYDMTTNQYSNWFMDNCQLIEYDLGD
jgi:probable phosphoglycerate mutase